MYRSCIFCSAALGANESIERFPVGKSLAFDAEKGRLWAVCPRCARWNLAPIEERWEAIEDAERLFHDCRTRAQRENIGLAKLADGTRMVRVGQAPAGEVAVARYGRAYQRRYAAANAAGIAAGTVGAAGAIVFGPTVLGLIAPVVLAGGLIVQVAPKLTTRVVWKAFAILEERRRARIPAGQRVTEWVEDPVPGARVPLTRAQLRGARLVPGEQARFAVHLPAVDLRLEGWHARALTARRLIRLNRMGGDAQDLAASVRMIESLGGPDGYMERAARQELEIGPRAAYYGVEGLALEMALHEEAERRALEGELAGLAEMWKQAEEIAAIADRLPDVPAPDPPRLRAEA